MSQSSRLTFEHVREVFHIVQEAIDLGNDPIAWREHVLARMCKLLDTKYGLSFVTPMQFDPKNLKPAVFAFAPLPPAEQLGFAKLVRSFDVADDPLTPVIAKLADRPVTRLRRQMVNDEIWYKSGSYTRWREPFGVDDLIHSHDPLPQFGVMSVMGFTRPTGTKPFTLADAKLVDLLREELRHRWISVSAEEASPVQLTGRQQQLLTHLKGQMSEKQIANYMGLSRHTAHNHIKALYRRLKINSRAELLNRPGNGALKVILPRIGYGEL